MKQKFTSTFLWLAVLFVVCLIFSNIFAPKTFRLGPLMFSGADLVFPISYILNDCLTEVYGYRKSRLVIWIGFAMNFFFILMSQAVLAIPGAAGIWDGQEHLAYLFGTTPQVVAGSLTAFLIGSIVNAKVMAVMRVHDGERLFWLRAILSSLAGEACDSLIFVPIAYFGHLGFKAMIALMLSEILVKVGYEVIILPLTTQVVKSLKSRGEE